MAAEMSARPIGILVAMEAELIHLLRMHPPVRTETVDAWRFHHLEAGETPVIAVRSGIGMVNAAAASERLIAVSSPRALLNFGCAGAHRREIMPGDLVIGRRVVHHSALRIMKDGSERFAGFQYEVAGERIEAAELASDAGLVASAEELAERFEPESWPDELFWPAALPRRRPQIHAGVVASADIWTQATGRLDVLHARHQSLCEDMEAAAIAQVAALHGRPFLTVKDISNNEYLQPSDIEAFSDFPVDEVGKRAAAFISELICEGHG